jgi:protein-S-isoprenylcysteine O-methyltransferase Ste14
MANMMLAAAVFTIVMVCWWVFAFTFLLRRNPATAPDQKRDPRSIPGVLLQALSYMIVWAVRRPLFTAFTPSSRVAAIIMGLFAVAVAIVSVVLVITAVKTLGKEWSITARVVTGHKLATTGPYDFVRHPIYTGMLGMLVATGIAVSYWPALLIAICVFLAGTIIRIRSEERLLQEIFGTEFKNYAQKTPALLPGLF